MVKLLAETGRIIKVTSTLLFHPDVIADMRKAIATTSTAARRSSACRSSRTWSA